MDVMTHKKVLRVCLACLFLSLSIISVRAQDLPGGTIQNISPGKQALIRELLELTSSKKTIDAMLKAQADQMEKQLPDIIWQTVSAMEELKSLTPAQREELRLKLLSTSRRSSRRIYELLLEKIDFNKVIVDISMPLHDKYFSESELRNLVAFYKSDTGKKVIEVMPNLMTESMTRAGEVIMPRIMELMTQMQQEETQRVEKEIQATVKTIPTPAKPARRTPQRRSKH